MANQIQHTFGTAAPASGALAKSEIAVRHIAANCTASSSSMLYVGEDAGDDGVTARALGTGVSGDSGQGGAAIGGNITFTGGTDITTSVSGSTVTITSSAGGGSGDITAVVAGTNLSGGATSGSATLNVDDAFLVNDANDTTSGTITAAGFTTAGSITLGGHSFNDIDIGSEFTDADDHLMSAGAIKEKIEDYGYTTASGDITAVTAGTNCSGGGSSGSVTINVDDAFLINSGNDTTSGTITAAGFTTSGSITLGGHSFNDIDIGSEFTDADDHLMSAGAIKEKIEDYGYTTATGDITGVTAGTGLSGGGSSGGVTLNVDAAQTQITSVGTIGTGTWQGTKIAGGYIANDAIDSQHYTDGSIDNAHIADDAINSEHYAAGSIDTAHIADDQITQAKMAANAIDSNQYIDGSIDEAHLNATNSPTDNYLLSYDSSSGGFTWVVSPSGGGGTVNTADIGDVSVTQTELAELETIGSTTISSTQWGYVGGADQALTTSSDASFTRVQVTGTGTVDINNGYVQVKGNEGTDGRIMLFADEGDDNADKWEVQATTGGLYEVNSKNSGSYVNMMTLSNAAQLTLGQSGTQNGRYQIVESSTVFNGSSGSFEYATAWMYDAMSGGVMAVDSNTITVKGGIITALS